MKTTKILLLPLSFLIVLSACGLLVKSINSDLIEPHEYQHNIPLAQTFCPLEKNTQMQLVGTNSQTEEAFLELISKPALLNLDFVDQFILWSLLQISSRPEQSSIEARFQTLIDWQGQTHYFDFYSEDTENQFPYLFGLEWILKKFKKSNQLEFYASLIDRYKTQDVRVGPVLSGFLIKNEALIKNEPQLSLIYVRGTQVLQENEKVPPLHYSSLIRFYRKHEKKQRVVVNNSLLDFATNSGNMGKCNYDLNLYHNSIFLLDQIIPDSNLFGLSIGKNTFLATSTLKLSKISPIANFPIFNGSSKTRSSAICIIEESDKKIWLVSNQSRDPGQHLFQLIRYGVASSQQVVDVDRLIRHSRYLFLSDPLRLVIESKRSRNEQIESLLKMNIPIYNSEKLGNIWSYTSFGSSNRFILDDRNPGAFQCK